MKIRPVLLAFSLFFIASAAFSQTPKNPILFVTQVPTPDDSATCTALFGSHGASMTDAPRGGALWIRYPDGSLKNLTKAAGFGATGFQGNNAIAVRQPCVGWDGTKALFSMVVGGATSASDTTQFYWQIYEVTGLGKNETPVVTKVANQPPQFNNVSPIYGTDGRIIFTSDRTITGERHLYPTMDEYKGTHTNTGLWSLDPTTGDLFAMDLSPSGDFYPYLDSYGRVLVMRWDRLQRDRNADFDEHGTGVKGTFNYSDETATAQPKFGMCDEIFPEPQGSRKDLLNGTNMQGFEFNQFFVWMINEDGSSPETINHIGRHEMRQVIGRSITDDSNVVTYNLANSNRSNKNPLVNLTMAVEDPLHQGLYYGVDALQFGTHSGGQIVSITAQPELDPDQTVVAYITNRATQAPGSSAQHTGFYRNPIPTSDGSLPLCTHTAYTLGDANMGTASKPLSHFDFSLKTLKQSSGYYIPDVKLTTGISDSVAYYKGNTLVTYAGNLWELDPVEVRARQIPPKHTYSLGAIESKVFTDAGITVSRFQQYLKEKGIALTVTRDITHRDAADHQQPFYLRVAGTNKQSPNPVGKVYDVSHMQFYQGDFIRGSGLTSQSGTPHAGRRVLAQPMHSGYAENPDGGGPAGSVKIADDGSLAAFVPARRPVSWELLSPSKVSTVRERYWVTFQPGDIRVCASCHGTNDAALNPKNPTPQNTPKALETLIASWKSRVMPAHVQLQLPHDKEVVVDQIVLEWKPDTLATIYHLQVASDDQFKNIIAEKDSIHGAGAIFLTAPASTYYWRVAAKNSYIDGDWSETWSFTTQNSQSNVDRQKSPVLSFITYPEPTSGGVTVTFDLVKEDHPLLQVFDMTGRKLSEYDCGTLPPGQHDMKLSLAMPNGTYLLKLRCANGSLEKTLHILR